MTATITMLLGAGIAVGVLVLIRSLRPTSVQLSDVVASLDRPRSSMRDIALSEPVTAGGLASWQRQMAKVGLRLMEALGLVDLGVLRSQLRVLDRTIERHAYEKVLAAVAGFCIPVAVLVVGGTYGATFSPLLTLIAAAVLGVLGFLYPDLPLSDSVKERQQAFRHALSAYLDLVTIILAGGGGIESALEGAAESGDGWAFAEIRGALRRASLSRRSPWEALDELGAELGIEELRELSASVALAGGQGARVKQSLNAKADAMRSAQAAQLETQSEVQTEKMVVPVVVLVAGMVMFIGYGAISAISGDSTVEAEPTVQLDGG